MILEKRIPGVKEEEISFFHKKGRNGISLPLFYRNMDICYHGFLRSHAMPLPAPEICYHSSGIQGMGCLFLRGKPGGRRWRGGDPSFSGGPVKDHRKDTSWDGSQDLRFLVEFLQ